MILPGQAVSLCDARDDGYTSVHRCDDPVACAVMSLADEQAEEGEDPDELIDELHELRKVVANVRALATDKRFKRSALAKAILDEIGTETDS